MGEESELERRIKKLVEGDGCQYWKLTSPGRRGVPDRMILIPRRNKRKAKVYFLEIKAPGEQPTKQQAYVLRCLHTDGFLVNWTDDYEDFEKGWRTLLA